MTRRASTIALWFCCSIMAGTSQARADIGLQPWSTIGNLPAHCSGTQMAVVGDYWYAMEGYEDAPSRLGTYYSPFQLDGSIGPWTATSERLVTRFDSRATTYGDYMYLVGGQSSGNVSTSAVEFAKANPDGTLSPWQVTTSYADARRGPAVAAYDGYVYVVGGYGPPSLKTVEYAQIQPDGSLGVWQETASTQAMRPYSTALARDGYLYVLGGQTTGFVTDTVERAQINPNGSLGPWQYDAPLPEPRGSAGVALLGDQVYLVGGNDSHVPLTSVVCSAIRPDHSFEPWQYTESVTHGSYFPHADAWEGYVYHTGGGGVVGGWIETTTPEPATLSLLVVGLLLIRRRAAVAYATRR